MPHSVEIEDKGVDSGVVATEWDRLIGLDGSPDADDHDSVAALL
jgi:hypothetical protein